MTQLNIMPSLTHHRSCIVFVSTRSSQLKVWLWPTDNVRTTAIKLRTRTQRTRSLPVGYRQTASGCPWPNCFFAEHLVHVTLLATKMSVQMTVFGKVVKKKNPLSNVFCLLLPDTHSAIVEGLWALKPGGVNQQSFFEKMQPLRKEVYLVSFVLQMFEVSVRPN